MESPTTVELALPGLEGGVVSEPQPQHYIVRGPEKRLMVFSGRSHPALAASIAEKLGVELGDVELSTFPNDETYCRYLESIRGADVFLVQTGCPPVDKNLMELLLMIQAAKLASAKRITAVIPWFPYSRQDRKAKPREPISARLVARMLEAAGADRVLTMDLHAGQIQGFFQKPVDHMTALPLFANHFRDLGLTGEEVVSVAPDAGRAKMAQRFAEMIEADLAIMHKTRPAHDQAAVTEIAGGVRDKIAIVGDDVIMTGGTLLANVEVLKEHGVRDVKQMSEAIFEAPFISRNVASMIASGERSGRLANVMERIAVFSEEELDVAVKQVTSYIEPIMIIFMGLVVGGVAMALLLPVFSMGKVMAGG